MNSFGVLFRVTLFGESHGPAIGVIIDGCPPGISVKTEDFLPDLKEGKAGAGEPLNGRNLICLKFSVVFRWSNNRRSCYSDHKK